MEDNQQAAIERRVGQLLIENIALLEQIRRLREDIARLSAQEPHEPDG